MFGANEAMVVRQSIGNNDSDDRTVQEVIACEEMQQPSELAERWASLLLAASLCWLRRRLINGRIFIQQASISTPDYWEKKMISDLQLQCEHEGTKRSGNQHGSFLHCRKCGMRLQYITVDERNRAQAKKDRNKSSRKKPGTTSWSEWDQQRPKKPAEPELNTEGRCPTRTSPTSATRGSASSPQSGLEQALIAMMTSQQEGMQVLSSQLQCMAKQQADSATALAQTMSSLQQSMVDITGKPRKKPATQQEIAQDVTQYTINFQL